MSKEERKVAVWGWCLFKQLDLLVRSSWGVTSDAWGRVEEPGKEIKVKLGKEQKHAKETFICWYSCIYLTKVD